MCQDSRVLAVLPSVWIVSNLVLRVSWVQVGFQRVRDVMGNVDKFPADKVSGWVLSPMGEMPRTGSCPPSMMVAGSGWSICSQIWQRLLLCMPFQVCHLTLVSLQV